MIVSDDSNNIELYQGSSVEKIAMVAKVEDKIKKKKLMDRKNRYQISTS
jgi:hypothetical protein